jgi:hypothetical protein
VRAFARQPANTVDTLPPTAVPTKHTFKPNKIVIPHIVFTLALTLPVAPTPLRWPDYVTSLPPWEQALLSMVAFVDRPSLFAALRGTAHLFLGSDGGAADCCGYFGALLAPADQILLECGGRAYSADPRSFRSEVYGMLAILRPAFHVKYFYCTRNHTRRFTLLCDSKSLIDQLEASRALMHPAPRRHLYSEADVEMQILSAITSLGPITVEHVKGHQDEANDGEPLLWKAQFNQRCDELATDHLVSSTSVLPRVPLLPGSKVDLTVQGTTLMHHFPSQLRLFAGLPAYREYLCRHQKWDAEVFDLTDWPTFDACLRTLSFLKRLFSVKWTNVQYAD